VPDQNFQLGQSLVAYLDAAQRVWQGADGVGDHIGATGVGFRLAWVQVGDATHGQAGQIGNLHTASSYPKHRRRSCPDQRSVGATRPGDNTPGSCERQGQ
jgi:hypothetical protein